ncbi:MAG: hypothetical protein SFU56_07150 [Capsulimonadales bacterium]|nr:hypothetical protein [Capsulimonadales bacterium]
MRCSNSAVRRTVWRSSPFLFAVVALLSVSAPAQTPPAPWSGHARDPQHTGISPVAAQPLRHIRWTARVDLRPQYSGPYLLTHYGSPVVTAGNTVIFPVKTAAANGSTGAGRFRIEARRGTDGTVVWRQDTNYLLPPHNWTPTCGPTLTPQNRVCFPGPGGTVHFRTNPDSATGTVGAWSFFGMNQYSKDPATYNARVRINTPITSDRAGNLFFGYLVLGNNPLNLKSGIARLTPTGSGAYQFASALASDPGMTQVANNCAPALSNDQRIVYVAVRNNGGTGYLVGLDSLTLAPRYRVALTNPLNGGGTIIHNDGTASPTVGPDGDVYYGTWNGGETNFRGWMLHFSADLRQKKTPGGFGWDDTASIVPAGMVPSYTGKSSYLIMTKYNNYAGAGNGDGVNQLAVLDPNDTQTLAINGATVMKEVLVIKGPTPDGDHPGFPNAVREWCINTAAVDPANRSIIVNCEDGKLYRWDLTSNTFTEGVRLTPGIGQAYTPTVIGSDGTSYAINNATLYAVGK